MEPDISKINVSQFLQRWREYVQNNDPSEHDIPVSLSFLASGKVMITYSLSPYRRLLETDEDLVDIFEAILKPKD